ncbi:MAG: F0F1 ATP synthase subunit B [Actinobacteria bacterium]|nr:F0F1 ATP synthase subunit B [Actinomycetota bacterium]
MLNPEWGLAVWTLITFAIAAFILWKFAFGPLQRVIDERRRRVQESIETAEEAREEAHRLLDEYKQTLASVRMEADGILDQARHAGEQARAQITDEARTQAERAIERAHEEITRDTQAAIAQLRAEVSDLTVLATEKILQKSLTAEEHQRLIEEALKEIESADLKLGERS